MEEHCNCFFSFFSNMWRHNWFNETKAQLSFWERYLVKTLEVGSRSWEDSWLIIIHLQQFEIGKRWVKYMARLWLGQQERIEQLKSCSKWKSLELYIFFYLFYFVVWSLQQNKIFQIFSMLSFLWTHIKIGN